MQVACSMLGETDSVVDKDVATKMTLLLMLAVRYAAASVRKKCWGQEKVSEFLFVSVCL